MTFEQNAIATFGSLPKTAYEIWLGAQAAHELAAKSGEHHHDEPAHFTLMLNLLILAVMGLLCLLAKRRYDQHIDQSTVLHDDVKACMLNAHTLHRFNKMTQDSDA